MLTKQVGSCFVSFKCVALVCPRKPRGLVRASSGALGWKHVICGCCRVTSQKRLSSRLQALSSLFFAVMPPILRIRLDGWFSRCRGQSSGKSASRQRSYEGYSRDVNEPIDVHAKSHAMFESVTPCSRESDLRRARCFSTVRLAPPHGRLVESDCPYGAEPRPCPGLLGGPKVSVISHHFWEGYPYRSLYMYNYAGY